MLDVHITTTTQVVIALLCYVTIYGVAVFLVSSLKWNIQSKCCFGLLAVLGSFLILAAGFTGLAFQLASDANSSCGLYHQRYSRALSYVTCQVHRIEAHIQNKSINAQQLAPSPPLRQKLLDEFIQYLQKKKPRECPERSVTVTLNNCNAMSPLNGTEFDLRKFVGLSEMPLCGTHDEKVTCSEKRRRLVERLNEALAVNEDDERT